MEETRLMLHEHDLPMNLCDEVARITMYVHNRTHHRVIDNKNHKEDFSGEKLEVIHLRILFSLVYIHIPKDKRTHINPSGMKGIFIIYSDKSNSYQIYLPGFKNINISRHVTFNEEYTYFRSKRTPIQEVEETKETRVQDMKIGEAILEDPKDHDMTE